MIRVYLLGFMAINTALEGYVKLMRKILSSIPLRECL